MDIKNFYPSIDPVRGSEIARLMWEQSNVDFSEVNIDQLAFYLGKFVQTVDNHRNLRSFQMLCIAQIFHLFR